MKIGIPKEVMDNENRVAITAEGVETLCQANHEVLLETWAGKGSGISDEEYEASGARVIEDKEALFDQADMILKVKQPVEAEFGFLREEQILFTFLYPETRPGLVKTILDKRITAVAYEEVRKEDGALPLLIPMSEIAGTMGILIGAQYLQTVHGGTGVALARIPGIIPPKVLILGGGTAGSSAAMTAAALGTQVVILEVNLNRLLRLAKEMPANVVVLTSNSANIRTYLPEVDLLINAAVWPPKGDTHLVTREMLSLMKRGAVIVDITADEAAAIETTTKKTHSQPTYVVDGVLHYCVPNIPGVVPKTSTPALSNATLPYVLEIANKGVRRALAENGALLRGLCFIDGKVTHQATAATQGLEYCPPELP